jgi:hypothetical protein
MLKDIPDDIQITLWSKWLSISSSYYDEMQIIQKLITLYKLTKISYPTEQEFYVHWTHPLQVIGEIMNAHYSKVPFDIRPLKYGNSLVYEFQLLLHFTYKSLKASAAGKDNTKMPELFTMFGGGGKGNQQGGMFRRISTLASSATSAVVSAAASAAASAVISSKNNFQTFLLNEQPFLVRKPRYVTRTIEKSKVNYTVNIFVEGYDLFADLEDTVDINESDLDDKLVQAECQNARSSTTKEFPSISVFQAKVADLPILTTYKPLAYEKKWRLAYTIDIGTSYTLFGSDDTTIQFSRDGDKITYQYNKGQWIVQDERENTFDLFCVGAIELVQLTTYAFAMEDTYVYVSIDQFNENAKWISIHPDYIDTQDLFPINGYKGDLYYHQKLHIIMVRDPKNPKRLIHMNRPLRKIVPFEEVSDLAENKSIYQYLRYDAMTDTLGFTNIQIDEPSVSLLAPRVDDIRDLNIHYYSFPIDFNSSTITFEIQVSTYHLSAFLDFCNLFFQVDGKNKINFRDGMKHYRCDKMTEKEDRGNFKIHEITGDKFPLSKEKVQSKTIHLINPTIYTRFLITRTEKNYDMYFEGCILRFTDIEKQEMLGFFDKIKSRPDPIVGKRMISSIPTSILSTHELHYWLVKTEYFPDDIQYDTTNPEKVTSFSWKQLYSSKTPAAIDLRAKLRAYPLNAAPLTTQSTWVRTAMSYIPGLKRGGGGGTYDPIQVWFWEIEKRDAKYVACWCCIFRNEYGVRQSGVIRPTNPLLFETHNKIEPLQKEYWRNHFLNYLQSGKYVEYFDSWESLFDKENNHSLQGPRILYVRKL